MIGSLITMVTRHEFSRSMRFNEKIKPVIPFAETKQPRLLYLHVPFCESLCPYCSFNRVLFEAPLCREYFNALRKEILTYKERGYDFQGIYVGGGTPTILIDELEETLLLAKDSFSIREISVETNPNHLTAKNIDVLRNVGVNRLSAGVQSFNDSLLKAMGRYEKYGSGEKIARKLGETLGSFDTLNADMIFNFPTQTVDTLKRDLDILIGTGVDQITYYPLMVSDSTRKIVSTTLGPVSFRQEEQFYHRIVNQLSSQYSLSSAWCFSRKTGAVIDEYIVDFDEYAGLGSGSIGYLDGTCYANTFDIRQYIDQLNHGQIPVMASRSFSVKEQIRYDFLMKLFGMELNIDFLREKYGREVIRYIWKEILAFIAAGGLTYRNGVFHLTSRGQYYWVIMMREFFTAVNNFRDFCMHR